MPQGKGTYGKKVGRPPAKPMKKSGKVKPTKMARGGSVKKVSQCR